MYVRKILRNATILGVEVQLELVVQITGDDITIGIPFPDNYPLTHMKKTLEDPHSHSVSKHIFYGFMNYSPEVYDHDRDVIFEKYNVDAGRNTLYLDIFYISARYHNLTVLPEEDDMLKGLGKQSLCESLNVLVPHFGLKWNDIFSLTASGGEINTVDHYKMVENYVEEDRDVVIGEILENYPTYPLDYLESLDQHQLASLIVTTNNNYGLVQYYIGEYGLIPTEGTSKEVPMINTIGMMMSRCGFK